ncbi:P-loop NTPase fold protein [Vibrio plantisponsor]|uniref:P-loop NTPase fold protein n=1 Tax=Vibrio plantisponsor TaxID=664643 RepID=UPI00370B6B40
MNNAKKKGYVLNLKAKWGSGKIYFINRWVDSIKDSHPVVYIDDWKQVVTNISQKSALFSKL